MKTDPCTCEHRYVGIVGTESLLIPGSGEYFWDCIHCRQRGQVFKTADEAWHDFLAMRAALSRPLDTSGLDP